MTYIVESSPDGKNVYGGNHEFLSYQGAEAIIHGPAETGKTFSLCLKLHLCACKYKNANIALVRKTQTSIYSTVLKTFTEKILGKREEWPCNPYGGDNKPEKFDYQNGSTIWISGLDKSSRLLSSEFDIVAVSQAEELTLEDWETITTRTTGRAGHMPYSQTIGDANPAYPTHWMYHRDSMRMFYSKHEENPALFNQATGEITAQGVKSMAVLDALTGVRKQRLRYGQAAQAEGAIYDEWNEADHLVYEDDAPQKYRRYVAGVDWGYRNPGVMGIFGLTHDDDMYLIAQYYRTGKRDDWWVEKALAVNAEFGGIEAFVCDPSEPAYIDKFIAAGLRAVKGNNSVVPGINAVKKRLSDKSLRIVRGSLRERDESLAEVHKPICVEDEFPAYVWADSVKEVPIKEDDHGVDMVRYTVVHVDGNSQPFARAYVY